MAGAPRLQEVQRFGAAHLADRDAVGPQSQRGADEVRERGDAVLGAQGHEVGRATLQLPGIFDQDDPVVVPAISARRALVSVVLPVEVPPATRMFAICHGGAERRGLPDEHDAGGDIIVEGEHRDGRLADRKGRGGPPPAGRSPSNRSPVSGSSAETRGLSAWTSAPTWCATKRTIRSPSAADIVRPAVLQTTRQPVYPKPGVGVEHHLDDRRVFEEAGDGGTERGAQHARTAGEGLGMKWCDRHDRPRHWPIATRD